MKKKFSQVFKSIRFAKLDPSHDKGPKGSSDDEEHYAIGQKEWEQQIAHAKKRAMQEETVDEARMSAAVKLQRAFEREQQKSAASRERAKELLQPKKPEPVKEDIEQLDEIGNTSKGQKLLQLVNRRAVARVTSKKAETDPVYAKKAQQNHLAANDRLKEDTLQEGRPSQRHPLEGHEYHKKTDAELEYIAKDAHKAAEAMKSHNTAAENKYRDQANDSATVRYFRKKNGMPDWYKKKYGHMKEETVIEAYNTVSPSSYDDHPMVAFRKKENEKPPFDGPYKKTTGTITDKSGAKHTPMSQARNLARQAMKSIGDKQKKNLKPAKPVTESKKAEIVKGVLKDKKNKDKFEAEPIISSSPDSKGTIDN